MENTINTAVEAVEAVNKIGLTPQDMRDIKWFVGGMVTYLVIDEVLIPAGTKAYKKIKDKVGKKKPIEVTAEEIIEVEE